MEDYIDRQVAIDAMKQYAHYDDFDVSVVDEDIAIIALKDLPSADVQPVRHGYWMLYENQNQDDVSNGNYLYVCSNCNHSDIHAKTVEVPFCWFCGAKMDEVTQ